jgi:hypothetical protein
MSPTPKSPDGDPGSPAGGLLVRQAGPMNLKMFFGAPRMNRRYTFFFFFVFF